MPAAAAEAALEGGRKASEQSESRSNVYQGLDSRSATIPEPLNQEPHHQVGLLVYGLKGWIRTPDTRAYLIRAFRTSKFQFTPIFSQHVVHGFVDLLQYDFCSQACFPGGLALVNTLQQTV